MRGVESIFELSRFAAMSVVLLLTLTWGANARAEPGPEPAQRYLWDTRELAGMKKAYPQAAAAFERGEDRLRDANFEGAADAFSEAAAIDPQSAIAPRRQCQVLAALRRHPEALTACRRAMANEGSNSDLRALVGVLMSGEKKPTPAELGEAITAASLLRQRMRDEPYGFAAQCDIAQKLGDTKMFNDCLDNLRRIAPDHYETRAALKIAQEMRPKIWMAAGWAAILLAALGTLAHALRRARPNSSGGSALATAAFIALMSVASLILPSSAHATSQPAAGASASPAALPPPLSSKYPILDDNPLASLPSVEERNHNPLEFGYLLMDLTDKAEFYRAQGDPAKAAKYYEAMAVAVPGRSVAFTKLCELYEAAGDLPHMFLACKLALGRNGVTLTDYQRYVHLVVSKKATLEPADIEDIDEIVKHMKETPSAALVGEGFSCELGIRQKDNARLKACTEALVAGSPDDPKTIYYLWSYAVVRKDWADASRLIARAKKSSFEPDSIKQMEQTTLAAQPAWRRDLQDWRVLTAIACAIALVAGMVFVQRRSTRRIAVPSAGNPSVT